MPEILWDNSRVLTEGNDGSLFKQPNNNYDFSKYYRLDWIVSYVVFTVIELCGLVGNGIVIWLLGFCLKRNHYGIYILNLAIADFIYLSSAIANYTFLQRYIPDHLFLFIESLEVSSYLVGLSLLMAISVDRCVSVIWPIWYKSHRPVHLSTIVCTIVWVFFIIIYYLITVLVELHYGIWFISGIVSLPTILVLLVSSLTLFIRVQCYSKQRKPGRLYWTILLNVLAFLLLSVPRGVYLAYYFSTFSSIPYIWEVVVMILLSAVHSTVNPIIYFFVGQYGRQRGRKYLREVLQRALTDNTEAEERRAPSSHRICCP
ncbi:mas-related G-protein coupled receptor member X1-like [Suncus etruscus]|uniref:mas-related G-protein coupled receptor member X1-like n=1 Tax=Suncus etruscus TaxID=109475 RepID=UPI00210FF8E4|nr:mas-related G-protein coupled receptor member X1-like [Suncus etruscus]